MPPATPSRTLPARRRRLGTPRCGSRTISWCPPTARNAGTSFMTRCRLGVAVLALPPRNAVLVAKQIATLDALSQGRVLLGVGTGWIEEELRYLGAAWQQRGALLDEAIQVLRTLWSDEGANSFAGRYTTFTDITCFP